MISLGMFDYVNVWPVYYDFLLGGNRDYELVRGNPSELNRRFKNGGLSASSLSSNQYPFLQDTAKIVADVVLATKGPVQSVLLVSQRPLEKLSEIFATRASCTSTVLLKIILKEMKIDAHVTVVDSPLEQLKKNGEAGLLIGDEALRISESDHRRYDLGKLWTQLTGKPFVWAIWGIQNAALTHASAMSDALKQSRDQGLRKLNEVSAKAAARLGIKPEAIERYYRNFQYELTDAHLEGLLEFYRKANEMDLGPKCNEIRFAEGKRCLISQREA